MVLNLIKNDHEKAKKSQNLTAAGTQLCRNHNAWSELSEALPSPTTFKISANSNDHTVLYK